MNRRQLILPVLLTGFLLPLLLPALLAATDYAGYAGSFLRLGTSARSIAMGSAFTAEPDRGFTAYHNPAGVVFLDRKQVTFIHHFLPLQRRFIAASYSTALPPTAGLGIAWVSSGVKDIEGRSYSGLPTETLSTSEDAIYVSFANRVATDLSVGLNFKLLYHRLPVDSKQLTGNGIGFDIGVIYRGLPDLSLGLMIQDLNSKYVWKTSTVFGEEGTSYNDDFPTFFRLGASYQRSNVTVTADYGYCVDIQEGYYLGSQIRVGTEYCWHERYFLRAGLGNGRAALGVGMNYSLWKKDDAYLDYSCAYELPTGIAHVFTYAFNL